MSYLKTLLMLSLALLVSCIGSKTNISLSDLFATDEEQAPATSLPEDFSKFNDRDFLLLSNECQGVDDFEEDAFGTSGAFDFFDSFSDITPYQSFKEAVFIYQDNISFFTFSYPNTNCEGQTFHDFRDLFQLFYQLLYDEDEESLDAHPMLNGSLGMVVAPPASEDSMVLMLDTHRNRYVSYAKLNRSFNHGVGQLQIKASNMRTTWYRPSNVSEGDFPKGSLEREYLIDALRDLALGDPEYNEPPLWDFITSPESFIDNILSEYIYNNKTTNYTNISFFEIFSSICPLASTASTSYLDCQDYHSYLEDGPPQYLLDQLFEEVENPQFIASYLEILKRSGVIPIANFSIYYQFTDEDTGSFFNEATGDGFNGELLDETSPEFTYLLNKLNEGEL